MILIALGWSFERLLGHIWRQEARAKSGKEETEGGERGRGGTERRRAKGRAIELYRNLDLNYNNNYNMLGVSWVCWNVEYALGFFLKFALQSTLVYDGFYLEFKNRHQKVVCRYWYTFIKCITQFVIKWYGLIVTRAT